MIFNHILRIVFLFIIDMSLNYNWFKNSFLIQEIRLHCKQGEGESKFITATTLWPRSSSSSDFKQNYEKIKFIWLNIRILKHHRSSQELWLKTKENRIYILEWNLLEKSVKRPFCCTVSILQVYFTYLRYITFLKHHFIESLKLILKENQIMKYASFIIDLLSFHIDSLPFTLQTMIFRYNYKSNDVFYSPNSFYKV